jgi:cytochrome c oxidase subunit 2
VNDHLPKFWGGSLLRASTAFAQQQSAVNAAGPQAGHIEHLWWAFFWILAAIFVIVIAIALWALSRRHRGIEQEPLERTHIPLGETERSLTRTVSGATVVTVLVLLGLLIASISTGKAISELPNKKNGMTIEVTGNQWWWYVRYLNDDPSQIVVTANEIHIPVGRPVQIRGTSNDVIHSFWVPNLHGKRDLIPSRVTDEWIQADTPGRYRGQCAEFCGLQHAHMALWVVADTPDEFEKWKERQLQPAIEPATPDTQLGRQVFLKYACVYCHSITGTTANGQVAPDLTHFASRFTLAAGTLPNTKGNLAGWIVDPQNIKPGNHMATINVKPEELQPLIDYLETLQ